MKKSAVILALGILLAPVSWVRADEPDAMEFVRGLRARNYPDLALEYLLKLQKTAPPEMANQLALEIAKCWLDLARSKPVASERPALYEQARQKFESFVQDYPNSPEASQAKLEITGIAVLLGKARLARALEQQSPEAKQADALKARTLLEDAAKQLKAAADELDLRLVKYDDAKTEKEKAEKKALQEAKLRAQLDYGINLLNVAQTYLDDGKTETDLARGKRVKEAREAVTKAAQEAEDKKSPVYWLAEAWIGRCMHLDGAPKDARTRLSKIIKSKPTPIPGLEPGRQLAFHFLMLVVPEDPQVQPDGPTEQRQLGEEFLKRFPNAVTTPDGCAVRFLLAENYAKHAATIKKDADKKPWLARAKKLYAEVAQTDNDYTTRARVGRLNVIFAEGGGELGPIAKLPDFDACYVRAQFEDYQKTTDAKNIKDPEKLDKKLKERNQNTVAALERGLKLVETKKSKAPQADLDNATAMLVYMYLITGKYPETVALGEKTISDRRPNRMAANVAMYTLQAYSQMLNDPMKLSEDQEEAIRAKLRDLAKDVVKRWPNELAADLAYHQLGMDLVRKEKFAEAVEALAHVRSNYGSAIHAQYLLAMSALRAETDKVKPPPGKKSYRARALQALKDLPPLPAGADPVTTQLYVEAKCLLAQNLFTATPEELKAFGYPPDKHLEMEKITEPLLQQLPKLTLPSKETAERLRANLTAVDLYAKYGRANTEFAAGHFDKVRAVLDPVVARIKADDKNDPKLRLALLGLALRANIQDGKLDKGLEVLKVLQAAAADNPKEGGINAILQNLAVEMRAQIEALRKKKDKAQLEKSTAGFTAFLDALRKQQQEPSVERRILLARSYASLDKYGEVVKLLDKVDKPVAKPGQDIEKRALDLYKAARLLYVHAQRELKQYPEARKALQEVLELPGGRQNLDALKENAHLLDAEGKPGAAATEWNKLVTMLKKKIKEPEMKAEYFECYFYLTKTYYHYACGKKGADRTAKIKQAAGFIVKLEQAWPHFGSEASEARFLELLNDEDDLKKEYEAKKKDDAKKNGK
jgi:hypothetical protein